MERPVLITIIVTSYNAGIHIQRCLDSISQQTFTNYEIVIIDALSADDTLDIIKANAEKDTRIRFYSEEDSGIYDAMNKGINKALGKWIVFLGSDDRFFSAGTLQNLCNLLESSKAGVIYGNVKIIGKTPWANDGDIYDGMFTVEKLFYKNICHQAIFYRREIFSKIGNYNTAYKISADWDLNHRCYAYTEMQYTDEIIAFFLAGGVSTGSKNDLFTSQDIVRNTRRYHHISYFNKLYKPCYWIFFNLSCSLLRSKKYFSSIYFLFFAVFYAEKKAGLLKNYMALIFNKQALNQTGSQ